MLVAAHDPGGALMIGAAVDEIRQRGHQIDFLAAGPAVAIWQRAGHDVTVAETGYDLSALIIEAPDAVVTGTGFGDFERNCWRWARAHNRPAMSVIDSWSNLARRFETPVGLDIPNAIGVIDEVVAAQLTAEIDRPATINVIGQPHLQVQTFELAKARAARADNSGPPRLIFFSEPVLEDFAPGARGFDQFSVFTALAESLSELPPATLSIKPHPREQYERWQSLVDELRTHTQFHGLDMDLSYASAGKLLAAADGVFGITSMALVEAHLLGVPLLSLQPGRTGISNPVIDCLGGIVLNDGDIAERVKAFIGALGTRAAIHPRFQAVMDGAATRFVSAVENLLEC
jgi:hypothetical protein